MLWRRRQLTRILAFITRIGGISRRSKSSTALPTRPVRYQLPRKQATDNMLPYSSKKWDKSWTCESHSHQELTWGTIFNFHHSHFDSHLKPRSAAQQWSGLLTPSVNRLHFVQRNPHDCKLWIHSKVYSVSWRFKRLRHIVFVNVQQSIILRNQLCINTAIVYMHRFFTCHSFTVFHRNVSSISNAVRYLLAWSVVGDSLVTY